MVCAAGGTDLGLYDRKALTFRPVARYPGLAFESLQMWVDEPHRRVLVAHAGEVPELPLPATAP